GAAMPTSGRLCVAIRASALREHRLRNRIRIRLEAWYDVPGDRALDEPLDIAQKRMLVDAYERDRFAFRARASRAADAMDVIAGDVGKIVVDDMRQLV